MIAQEKTFRNGIGNAVEKGGGREMGKRLESKVAIVVGAGQTAGDTIGNGRAISLLFAREGAKVLLADCRLDSALQTKEMIDREGGEALAFEADITRNADCRALTERCVDKYGRIDILVNNAGIGAGAQAGVFPGAG